MLCRVRTENNNQRELAQRPAGESPENCFSTKCAPLPLNQNIDFDRHFEWKQQISGGTRGPLYRAVCKKTYQSKLGKQITAGSEVAVKVILLERLSTLQRARLQTEFQILRKIGNIETCEELLDGFQTTHDLLLVKTLCATTPLCDAASAAGCSTEALVADFTEPAFATVAELHSMGIVHGCISVSALTVVVCLAELSNITSHAAMHPLDARDT